MCVCVVVCVGEEVKDLWNFIVEEDKGGCGQPSRGQCIAAEASKVGMLHQLKPCLPTKK